MEREKAISVADTTNTANDSALSLALRRLQAVLTGPVFWVILGAAIVLTAFAGPYYTLERFTFPQRLVYWGTTHVISAVLMSFLSIYAGVLGRKLHWLPVALAAGLVGVLPVVGSIYLAEGVAVGFAPGWSDDMPFGRLVASVAPPLLAVTLLIDLLFELRRRDAARAVPMEDVREDAAPKTPPPAPSLTLLQSKLPHHLGHEIVTVQARDHYVEITTPEGSAMVLMRLTDAVVDLGPLNGMQIHRSWWINLDHISEIASGANGPEVTMSSGQRIAVGRSFRDVFRETLAKK